MMENRSFDHLLSWLPGADGRANLTYLSTDGNVYPNFPLAPDFQGCGYSDPDHSWEGFLVQFNGGRLDGFLQRPTPPGGNPGVTLAAADTFPIGYYTNRRHLPRPCRRRLPGQHRPRCHVRRVGRVLRPRPTAPGDRRHQPGHGGPHRRRHHRRPDAPQLRSARVPGMDAFGKSHKPIVSK